MKAWLKFLLYYLWVAALGSAGILLAAYLIEPSVASYNIAEMRRAVLRQPKPSRTVRKPGSARLSRERTARRPQSSWGVVKSPAAAYDSSGSQLASLRPGTVVEVSSVPNADGNGMAECRIISDTGETTNILVHVSSLDIRRGDPASVSAEEKFLATRAGELSAKIENKRKLIGSARDVSRLNPHRAQFEAARSAYQKFWKKSEELRKKRDASVAGERMRYAEELFKMKGEDVRIGQAYQAAKQNFDAWNAQHDKITPAKTELAQLEKQLADINTRLEQLGR